MKVTEEFVVQEPPQRLWEFFEQIDRVARCLPGVEDVEVIDSDNSRLRVTQALGPMSATFDMKMRITERDPGRAMQFTAIGRTVRGAAGNIRTANVVRLQELDDGAATRVILDADVALGGMIGSVGQKVVAKQAGKVTRTFAETLERELRGEQAAAPRGPGSPHAEQAAAPHRPGAAPAPATVAPTPRGAAQAAAPAAEPASPAPSTSTSTSTSMLSTTVPVPLPLVLAVIFGAGYLAGRAGRRR